MKDGTLFTCQYKQEKEEIEMKRWLIVGAMLGLVFVLATSLTPTSMAGPKEIRIGVSAPMSGTAAGWGIPPYQAAQLHAEKINAAGGVDVGGKKYTIKVFGEDNKYQVAAATAAMEKMVYRDKINVLWTFGGAPVLATQKKLERIPMLHFIVGWDPKVRGPQFPYTYSTGMIPADFAEELFAYCKKRWNLKTTIIVNENSESGIYCEREGTKAAKAAGYKVLPPEWYEVGTTDFYPMVSRIIATKADSIMGTMTPPRDAAMILKQRDELGGEFVYIHWSANVDVALRTAPKASENKYPFRYQDFSQTERGRAFEKAYVKKWKENPEWSAQEAYDFVGVYTKAVQIAGTLNSVKVKAALDAPGFTYDGVMGDGYKFGGMSIYKRNSNMYYPIGVAVIKNGKVKVLDIIPVRPK